MIWVIHDVLNMLMEITWQITYSGWWCSKYILFHLFMMGLINKLLLQFCYEIDNLGKIGLNKLFN